VGKADDEGGVLVSNLRLKTHAVESRNEVLAKGRRGNSSFSEGKTEKTRHGGSICCIQEMGTW